MGCDIHCYIEHRAKGFERWDDFGIRINPGRNYWMFGFMAGVRCEDFPHIIPRGFPEDAAYAAFDDEAIYINDGQIEDTKSEDGSFYYSPKHAQECVAKGYCRYIERNGKQSWVSNSDHHTHSWLNADEFELCIAAYLKQCGFQINTLRLMTPEANGAELSTMSEDQRSNFNSICEYWPILAAMRCFEAMGRESRLVFWFDN